MNKIFSLTLILLFYTSAFSQWEIVSEMPVPVKGAKAIVQDTVIYIIGGVSDSLIRGSKKIQAYYPESNHWQVLQDTIIVPRFGLSVESYGDSAYIFGGAITSNDSSYSIEKWGYSDNAKIKDFDYNFNRSFASTSMIGDHLYIFGGYQDFELYDSLSYIVRFDMRDGNVFDSFSINDSFSVEMPSHQMSAVMNDKVFLFGGTLGPILRKISYLDLTNDSWIELDSPLNKPRASGVALPHPNGEEIILIGGKNEGSEALSLVETFNINSYLINDMKYKMSVARSQHAAVIYKDWIYVFGGKNAENIIVGDVEKIMLDSLDEVASTHLADAKGYFSKSFELIGNYPNPFNPQTSIIVQVNNAQHLAINIYDIQGRKIKSLYDNIMTRGKHAISWDATDDSQQSVTSGIYFYTVSSGDIIKTNRMLFIK